MGLFALVAVIGFYFSEAIPIKGCSDHYEYCGQWAKNHYCDLDDYRPYMKLVCPYSCGVCDDFFSGYSSSGEATFDNTVENTGRRHESLPEIDTDLVDLGSAFQQSSKETHYNNESWRLSGSGDQPLFPVSAVTEGESQFEGDSSDAQDRSIDQQVSASGSGVGRTGAHFWTVVRIEPNRINTGSDRELRITRRSEKSFIQESTRNRDAESGSGTQTSGEMVSQEKKVVVENSSRADGSSVVHPNQRTEFLVTGSSDEDNLSGEDDSPFDNSSAGSEFDSGCSSGDGCYESETVEEEDSGESISRSVIAKAEGEHDISSGSAEISGDSWGHPHFDILAGPYEDKTVNLSNAASNSSGSGSTSELGNALHDIEDAIFDTGIPLKIAPNFSISNSGRSNFQQQDVYMSGSGSDDTMKVEKAQLNSTPKQHRKIQLIEKMMRLGKLHAVKISHVTTVGATGRDQVPELGNDDSLLQSDLGQGRKVSFVLNQDFHNGYDNENSAAYNILASNVKKEVERALGSDAIVSEISFSEVREPAHGPRFSKVLTSLKLLGDVTELEKMVKKGSINNLIVDKNFFHAN